MKTKANVKKMVEECEFNAELLAFKLKYDVQSAEDFLFDKYCAEAEAAGYDIEEESDSQW